MTGSTSTLAWIPLRESGLVNTAGEVVGDLAARLDILNAPDVEVVMVISRGPVAWGAGEHRRSHHLAGGAR